MANGLFGGGNGTTASPYLVEDEFDLKALDRGLTKHYKQINDIHVTQERWFGIASRALPFTGTFDGAGYKITGLVVRYNNWDDIARLQPNENTYEYYSGGLFNAVVTPGVVKNVSVDVFLSMVFKKDFNLSVYVGNSVGFNFGAIVGYYSNPSADIVNCHSNLTVETEMPRRRSSGYAIRYFYANGLVAVSGSSTVSCSSKITVNNRAVHGYSTLAGDSEIVSLELYSDYRSFSDVSPKNTNFKSEVVVNSELSEDTFTLWKSSCATVTYNGSGAKTNIDCELKLNIIQKFLEGTDIYVPLYVKASLLGGATRCSLVDSHIEAKGTISPFNEAKDCKTLSSTLISLDKDAFGINGTTALSERCLVKDCYIQGVTNAAGIGSGNATDCCVTNTNIKSASRVAGVISGQSNVTRCVFSGGWVEGNFSHIGGLLTSTSSTSKVTNSFFLGQYVKGLGATTIQSGIISALGHSGNANNYSLDTSLLILE